MSSRIWIFASLLLTAAAATAAEPLSKFRPAAAGGIAGEYIVVLEEGVARDPLRPGSTGPDAAEVAQRLAARYGARVERVYAYALPGFAVRATAGAARRLAADPAVRLVEQNARVDVNAIDSCDPLFRFPAAGSVVEGGNPVSRGITSPETIACSDPDPINRTGDPDATEGIQCIDNWGLDLTDGARNDRYDFTATGDGVHVYLIDLGIDAAHSEFLDLGTPAAGDTRVRRGFNAAAPDTDPDSIKNDVADCVGNGHGTHVAAIVGGNTFGVAKNAFLHPVKFEDRCGNPPRSYDGTRNTVINGIDWILRNHNQHPDHMGPAVVNFSGGNGSTEEMRDGVMAFWVRRLLSAGIGLVQSAGNQDDRTRSTPTGPKPQNACLNTLTQHAHLRDALIVAGGIDETRVAGVRRYHRWSREGDPNNSSLPRDPSYPICEPDPRHDCGSNSGTCADGTPGVDVWAPAAHIVSAKAGGGACRLSGTSMAAPHVAGVAALLLERFPTASPSAIKKALLARAQSGVLDSGTLRGGPDRLLRSSFPTTGAPVAGDDWFTTPPGNALVIFIDELLRGDLDWDRDPLVLADVGDPQHGVLQVGSDRLTYFPHGGFSDGVDSFEYTVSDGHGGSDTATISIEVKQPPSPPLARDDCYATPANTDLALGPTNTPSFLDNDAKGEFESFLAQDPPHGRVGQLNHPSEGYVYRPDPGFIGTESFTYFIYDTHRQKSGATVTVHVGGGACPVLNEPPAPADDAFTTPFNTSVSFFASTLLANDTDPDDDEVFFDGLVSDHLPVHGHLAIDGIGPEDIIYRYVPDPGFIGTDSFGYQVRDEPGATATATVRITVTSAGFGGNPDHFVVTANGRLRVLASQLTANDSAGAVFIRAENPRHGSLTIAGIGPEDIVYDFYPDANFLGEAGFEYLISPNGNEPYTRVNVVVQVVDGPPVAGFAATCTGTTCSFDASRSSDDLGIGSYAWSFGDGTTGGGMNASHTYSRGLYPVTLTVTDTAGQAASDDQVVTADAPPVASFTVSCSGRTCTFDASGSSDDGGIVAYTWAFGDGATGSGVTVSHTYATSGSKTAVLTVRDTVGQTASTNRTVTIDLAPTACFTASCTGLTCSFNASCSTDDLGISSYAWNFGDGATGSGSTASRTYASSGPRTVTLTVTDTGGKPNSTTRTANPDAPPVAAYTWSCTQRTCSFNGTGSTDNQPLAAYAWTFGDGATGTGATVSRTYGAGGSYSVKLTVTDSVGQKDDEIKSIAVNRPPAAAADSGSTFRDTAVDLNVLANDSDPDGNPLTVTAWTQGAHGGVTKNANGTLRYAPHAGYTGGDSFSYTISDGKGDTASASVAMTVTVPNNPPDARDDGWRTYQNGPTNIPYTHLLANDYDPNGDALVVTGVNAAGLTGTLDCSSGTWCRYTPPSWFVGATSFTYNASDGKGGLDPATVRIKVGIANGLPAPQDDIVETTRNTPLAISRATILANDADPDGDVLSIMQLWRLPAVGLGTVSCSAGYYTCTYTPPAGFTGVDVLSYRATDGIDFTDARLRILVRPGSPPALDAREDQIFSTTTVTYISYTRLLSNDYDPEGGPLTIVGIDTTGLMGTLDCTTYSTGCDYYRGTSDATRFKYTVRDPQGNLDTTTVTIKPGNWSFNKVPVLANDTMTATRNTPKAFTVFDLFRNDYDPDNDQLNIPWLWYTQYGRITCSTPAYACTYTPNTNFSGVDTFTYAADDGTNSASATVTVNVAP